jgi:predicted amidohydrolase
VTHPAFLRAQALSEPLRSHFPKSVEEAEAWQPIQRIRALSSQVLVVAQTRIICQWAAYIDAVPGLRHDREWEAVLNYGNKLEEVVARALFPEFEEIPYAE